MTIPNLLDWVLKSMKMQLLKHPYEPKELRHYNGDLTNIRPPEAEVYF